MIALLRLAATMALLVANQAFAAEEADPVGVVELFTSQGCSSCPPADRVLEQLIETDHVIGLAYHVDYWNYLGWADTLGSKANTDRQYGYAKTLKRNTVYTPQAVLNGKAHVNGADIAAVRGELAQQGKALPVTVHAKLDETALQIDIGSGTGKADIVVAYFMPKTDVKIERGENSGSTISYVNSVAKLEVVGMWDGSATSVKLPATVMINGKSDFGGCAILLQQTGEKGEPGAILGANIVYYEEDEENEAQ